MVLKNHVTIDKFMLEKAKDRSELIEYVTKNMKRNLVEAMLDKIEPEKDYLIRLKEAEYYEKKSTNMCEYKMTLRVDGWIPCSERLPNVFQKAVVCNIHGEMMIGAYTEFGWMFPCYFGNPIAWMPLPEPYKEK